MKMKLATVISVCLVSCSVALAQTTPADDATAILETADTAAADAAATEATASEIETPLIAQVVPETDAVAADQPVDGAEQPTEPVAAVEGETAAAVETDPPAEITATPVEPTSIDPAPRSAEPPPGDVIPLIQFQEVSLTTAIENLARQANINYILDPKINYGQMDDQGNVIPQPIITLRWENITPGQALLALLQNYGLQLVEDPKTDIARVTVKDPAAPEPLVTHIIQLKFASPSNVLAAVQGSFTDKRSKVVPDQRTSQLVILATEREQESLAMLIERLDTQTRQVLIEAKLIETRINPSTMKGIDWSGTLAAQNITFGNGNISGTTTTTDSGGTGTLPGGRPVSLGRTESTTTETLFGPALGGVALSTASGFVPATAFLNADGVNAVLSFLNQHAEGRVVSAPRTVTLDNEKSSIEVGTLYPIVNVTAGTANTTGGSQITYSNLTVNLDVTPRISANDYVNLKVRPTVMRLGPRFTTTVAGQANSVDSFLTRTLDTTVLIPSGNTLVMGGLMNDETLKQNTKVPLLGDIPFLGYAFRKDSKSREKNNLIIFVTPTIVTDKDFQPTTTTYLQNPVPKEDTVEPEWSAWDSGKPHDWSKTR